MTRELADSVRGYLEMHYQEQISFLKGLVLAESPSLEPTSQQAVFDLLAEPLHELAFKVTILKGRQSGGQFYARPLSHRRGTPCQLLLGHCDTVWPVGTLQHMPLTVDGNIMKGPGVYDMKAGLCQIVFALKALSHCGVQTHLTPVIFFSTDEELGSEDSRFRIQLLARRVRRVLIPEPSTGSEGKLKTSRKGVGLFEIVVRGRAAHAGVEPEAGISAVLELSYIVQQLHQLNDPGEGITLTVGLVEGGTRPNIIPDRARAVVDLRTPTLEAWNQVEQAIRGISATLPGAEVEILGGLDRPPMERTARNRVLWDQAVFLADLLDLDLQESHTGGGSDGNLTSPFAATLDGLGGVGGGAHAPHEYIRLDQLTQRTALMALLLAAPPL